MTEALVNNPKIEVLPDQKFVFKAMYKIRDRKSLLRLLKQQDLKGLGGILLEDIQESLPHSEKALKVFLVMYSLLKPILEHVSLRQPTKLVSKHIYLLSLIFSKICHRWYHCVKRAYLCILLHIGRPFWFTPSICKRLIVVIMCIQ